MADAEGTIDPIFVSVKAAAQAMGVSTFTMYDLLNKGSIESRYQGTRRLVVVKSLREYVSRLPTEREAS